MSGIRVEGSTSGNVAEVTAENELLVTLPQAIADAGLAVLTGQMGDGKYTSGDPYRKTARVSLQDRLLVGIDTPEFDYNFTATIQDTGVWKFTATTQTMSASGGFVLFNANSTLTTTTGCSLQTWRTFNCLGNGAIRVAFDLSISSAIPANEVHEVGLFFATTTTAPADGVYIRLTNAGIIGVLNYNGTETPTTFSAQAVTDLLTANNVVDLSMQISVEGVEFYIEDQYLGFIETPAGNAFPFLTSELPVCMQSRNSGAVTGVQQMKVGHVRVTQMSVDLNVPFPHQQCAQGSIASQAQQGTTGGSTALYSNSLAAGTGVAMTNTTAALGAGLGGQFSALPTLAAGTDGILCSYQNPAGSVTIQPRTFMCTGVRVQGAVTTTLAGGPVLYAYSLAYGHTAPSMATAEGTGFTTSPTTKAPRRVAIGFETFAATAAAGVVGSPDGVRLILNSPIPINPGEYIAVCAKNLGTVTSAGVITCLVTFDGYWI